MTAYVSRVLFLLFFVSGFCGLLYQLVWTRLAFAAFGIITPVLSIVISTFMLGLSLGAWAGGRFIGGWVRRTGWSAITFYSFAEALIGLGAFLVPKLFEVGERLLLNSGQSDSLRYLFLSALVLAVSILPWCLLMGATFPLVIAYVREGDSSSAKGFSFLYLANVLGAMIGTLVTAFVLIECLGFRHTLWVAAGGNFCIALISAYLGRKRPKVATDASIESDLPRIQPSAVPAHRRFKWILFSTGFSAMAMEVVWTRLFTPVLKTQVYSFALVVFAYLGATFVGSLWYRRHLKRNAVWSSARLMSFLVVALFLPLLAVDSRFVKMEWAGPVHGFSALFVLASIFPFCGLLGYLTPSLVDSCGGGHPKLAGEAYAINVLGCILGPLFACYFLLPWLSEQTSLMLLSLPFFLFYFLSWRPLPFMERVISILGVAVTMLWALFLSRDFERYVASFSTKLEVRRDHVASVISANPRGNKILLVNGMGMTYLTPVTKFMIHLPLTMRTDPADSALVICFGMGTTYRSALSWGLDTTTVELVPGVTKAFGYYHPDADRFVNDPRGHIVIDDGRRFLRRTAKQFDVIVVDPPPPVSAAGSSLLFSKEFCELARDHLKPHGILQMWFPDGTPASTNLQTGAFSDTLVWATRRKELAAQAVVRSLQQTFPYTRVFLSIEGAGIHILASMERLELPGPEQLAVRLPSEAKKDLMEWNTSGDSITYLGRVFQQEIPLQNILNPSLRIEITDDSPINEYFLLRQTGILRP